MNDVLDGLTEEEIAELAKEGRRLYVKRRAEKAKEARRRAMQRYYARYALREHQKEEQNDH